MSNPADPYLISQSPEYLGGERGAFPLGSSHLAAVAAATAVSTPHSRVGGGALRAKTSAPHLGRGISKPAATSRRPLPSTTRPAFPFSVRGRKSVGGPIFEHGGWRPGEHSSPTVPLSVSSSPDAFGPAQHAIVQLQRPQQLPQQLPQQQHFSTDKDWRSFGPGPQHQPQR
ncbi:hypothetical protein KCU81_g4611, partial [Aureobasidium melanogenum]|uniref:Uncharacterized protein n=1 Tax=Aureobasidium melanogenum (strain CBS 110374) TaxID=1043003 RepID=A0A074VTA3_AURM1